MQAVIYRQYGPPDVLRLERTEQWVAGGPSGPDQGARGLRHPLDCTTCGARRYLMRMDTGWRAPKSPRLGADVAGVVVEVGKERHAVQAR
jgi:hypothetical protein